MNGQASFPTHELVPRGRQHVFVRRHDERVSPLVREVVVLLEYGKLDGAKVLTDFGEREPADLDEGVFGREQTVVLVRVVHVLVDHDERRHGVEHFGGLARVGHRLVGKVGCRLDNGEVRHNFCWGRERRVQEDSSVEVSSMVLRARLGRIR